MGAEDGIEVIHFVEGKATRTQTRKRLHHPCRSRAIASMAAAPIAWNRLYEPDLLVVAQRIFAHAALGGHLLNG